MLVVVYENDNGSFDRGGIVVDVDHREDIVVVDVDFEVVIFLVKKLFFFVVVDML